MLTRNDLNIALTANESHHQKLHREVLTVGQAMEREEYEQHMDAMESDEKWHTMHQGDNQEFSS